MLYGCLDKNVENVNNSKGNFKRTVDDVTSDDSDSSPKRTRVESIRRAMAAVTGGDIQDDISQDTDMADTVVAASPIDRGIKLGHALLRLAKSIKERAKALDKWEGSLNKREGSLDKREGSMDKREASIDKRETSVEKLEGLAAKKTEEKAKAKPAKGSDLGQAIDNTIDTIGKADNYTTVLEKLTNIPKRGTELVKNYNENKAVAQEFVRTHNKQIARKVKEYLKAATTAGAVNIAKAAVMEGLKEILGFEGGEEAPAPDGEEAPAPDGEQAPAPDGEKASATEGGEKASATEGGEKASATEGGEKASATEGGEKASDEAGGDDVSGAVAESAGATESESRK